MARVRTARALVSQFGVARLFAALLTLLGGLSMPRAIAQRADVPENYRATLWNTANGLPQGSINDVLQTADGELWIATFAGLLRFDGITFHVYDLDTLPGLSSNRITALAGDGADGLWFATQHGALAHLVGRRVAETFHVPSGSRELLSLVRSTSGVLWVQDSSGNVFRCDAGAWQSVGERRGVGHYRALCAHPDGSVSAGMGRDLVVFESDGRERARLSAPSEIFTLASGPTGMWLGLADGIGFVNRQRIERFLVDPPLSVRVTSILDNGDSGLWVGSELGPIRLLVVPSVAPPIHVDAPLSMPTDVEMRCIVSDREGNLWFGTNGKGLVRLRPMRVEQFGPALRAGQVVALCADGDGGAWVANDASGLGHIAAGTWTEEPHGLRALDAKPVSTQSLLRDRLGRVWLGFDTRVLRREPGTDREFVPVLPSLRLTARVGPMVETSTGDVWISTAAGHLVRVDSSAVVQQELDLPGELVSLAAAPDGSLWVGGVGQVFHVVDGRVETFGADANMPRGDVRSLLAEADGGVWIATYGGGLGHLADGKVRRFSREAGLPDNSLSCILDDGLGRLWILSNLGLIVLERAELDAVLAGTRTHLEPVVVGPEAGMNEASYGSPAGFRDSDGWLWFATIAGPVRIDATNFPANRTAPAPRFERAFADEMPLALGALVTVPAGSQRVVFEYATSALVAPERVRFRYRLDGFDRDWNDGASARSASYTGLAPGSYEFHVSARNEEGVWSDAPASVQIEVLPSWWQTSLFRVAAVLAVCGALLTFHRLRIRGVHRRAQALLAVNEQRRTAEESAARLREELEHIARVATAGELATSLAHEVNQPLAAIVTNAQAGLKFLAAPNIPRADIDEILRDIAQQGQRASDVIRRLRAFLRKDPAERRPLALGDLVRETLPLVRRELDDHQVRVALDLAPDLPRVDADLVGMQQVLVNLVKNACEAMSELAGERRIAVRTRAQASRVLLEVQDNGPGIAAEIVPRLFQPFTTTKRNGMGLGLAICRSIIEAHDGRLSVESAPGGGVLFRIDLPLHSAVEVQA